MTHARTKARNVIAKPKKPDTDLTEALGKILAGEDKIVIRKNGKT